MNVALVQHAQHDVHGHHRCQNQQQGARQRGLKRLRRTLELGLHTDRHADVFAHLIDQFNGLPQRHAGRQVERDHHRGELADVRHGQLRLALFNPGQVRQANLSAVGGFDVDLVQRLRADFLAVLRLQHHTVLAGLRVDGRNLPLPERVIQRIRDIGHRNAQAGRSIAINH